MGIKSEEICKQCFHKYLSKELKIKDVMWSRGGEPPDYYLKINDVEYAVEQTNIMEKVTIDESELSIATVIFSCKGLGMEVKEKSLSEDFLNGTYVIVFSKPITNLSSFRNDIKERLLNYVRRTQNDLYKDEEIIFEIEDEKITIQKINNQSKKIHIGGLPRVKWSGSKQEALNLVQDRINDKIKKLSGIKLPKILLLLNEHFFYNLLDYKYLFKKLRGVKKFHTIFIVGNENNGYPLYSRGF